MHNALRRSLQSSNNHTDCLQPAESFSLPQNFDFSHLLQPEPVGIPRKALDQRFAVLLLRSTYDAVDSLDFIAMVRINLLHELQHTNGCAVMHALLHKALLSCALSAQ